MIREFRTIDYLCSPLVYAFFFISGPRTLLVRRIIVRCLILSENSIALSLREAEKMVPIRQHIEIKTALLVVIMLCLPSQFIKVVLSKQLSSLFKEIVQCLCKRLVTSVVEYFEPEYGRKRWKDCFLVRCLPVRRQQSFKSGTCRKSFRTLFV